MQTPQCVLFDLDNTLVRPLGAPTDEMAGLLKQLLERMPAGVITAASYPRLDQMLVAALPPAAKLENLYLLPDMGGLCYHWQQQWELLYENPLSEEEREHIVSVLKKGLADTGVVEGVTSYGERIEAHEAQVIFTALGIDAPAEQKLAWDPDGSKREQLRSYLLEHLEGFDVYIGGRTTIDITRKGFDKSYGVRRIAKHLQLDVKDMLYVGDELYPGGNDASVLSTGIQTRQVANPEETAAFIKTLLFA